MQKYTYDTPHGKFEVLDDVVSKAVRAADGTYGSLFDKINGTFIRVGKTEQDDPDWCALGPELLDIEISENGCEFGVPGGCRFCYKGNTNAPATNMSVQTFEKVVDVFPKNLTQIALGITSLRANPDLVAILQACRARGVVPNLTTNGRGLDDAWAKTLATHCGANAVSVYEHAPDVGYEAIARLKDAGLAQVNVHLMVAEQTKEHCLRVLRAAANNEHRLREVGAFVLLALKPKGRAKGNLTPLSLEGFDELVDLCLKEKVPFGFDSCSGPRFMRYVERKVEDEAKKKHFMTLIEPCESGLFSFYVNVHGRAFPCSFTEDEAGWEEGIDVTAITDFQNELWLHPRVVAWRKTLLEHRRACPVFNVGEV